MESDRRLTLEEIQERHPELIGALRDAPAHRLAARALGGARRARARPEREPPARRTATSRARTRWRRSRRPRRAHLLRTDGFAHVADIMVGSFYDPELDEGCAFEELICFHGGLGGLQTRPFLLYPPTLTPPSGPIIGAAAVHARAARLAAASSQEPAVRRPAPRPRSPIPRPGAERDLEPAVEGVEPVVHVAQADAVVRRGRVEARAVVAHLEAQLAAGLAQADRDAGPGPGVLGRVLQRLEAAVVDGGLDRPAGSGRCRRRRRRPRRPERVATTFERADDAGLGQRRRVDAVGEPAQLLPASPRARPRARRAGPARPSPAGAARRRAPASSSTAVSCCCAPSWRSRSSARRSTSPAAAMRARDSRSCRSESVHASSSSAFSWASSATAPAACTSSGSSASCASWMIATAGRPSRSTAVSTRSPDGSGRDAVAVDPVAAARERQNTSRRRGSPSGPRSIVSISRSDGRRSDASTTRRSTRAGEQLGGDERQQEAVPEAARATTYAHRMTVVDRLPASSSISCAT